MASLDEWVASVTAQPQDGRLVVAASDPAGGFLAAGSLAALSVSAAAQSAPDAEIRSAHSVFLRAASPAAAVDLEVETLHGGRQMGALLVRAAQDGRLCASTQVLTGPRVPDLIAHQSDAPAVARPDQLAQRDNGNPAEIRVVDDVDPVDPETVTAPAWQVWVSTKGLPGAVGAREAFVAYQANTFLVSASVLPHKGVSMASAHHDLMAVINTSDVTYHRPVPLDAWLLFSQESTYAGAGWVFGRGQVFDEHGELVASFAEEAMLRPMPAGRSI
jgi:acyl-CoA thioesterase II